MGSHTKRTLSAVLLAAMAIAAALVAMLGGGGTAGAHTTRQVSSIQLLTLSRGAFEVSLGTTAPEWRPLSGTAETLTLIGGAPKLTKPGADNAYVGFTSVKRSCAATPADSKRGYATLTGYYTGAHAAGAHAGVFAPNGGAARGTYIDSVSGVVIPSSIAAGAQVRACVWLATSDGATTTTGTGKKKKHKKARRSLVTSIVVPLVNHTFAASISNLTDASPGSGGYSMYAIDGGHAYRYSAISDQCGAVSKDGAATIAAGIPGSESVAISKAPCTTDATTFTFSGADVSKGLTYPIADALASPSTTVGVGGCELDPLTGVTVATAELYLSAVGCKLGTVEYSPYEKTLTRGNVSWAAVDGAVAELAPAGTTVDLVLNGKP